VTISGDFTSAGEEAMIRTKSTEWQYISFVEPGKTYHYHFNVDGMWIVDKGSPVIDHKEGGQRNILS